MLIWPGDLVFDPRCSSLELDLEIIKTNILSQFHDDCLKNVTVRVLTRFSADLAQWPSFWPHVTQFLRHILELIKTNILSKIHDYCFKNVTARVLTRFSAGLTWWPSFWPHVTQFPIWPRNYQDFILSKIHDDCLKNVTARVLTSSSSKYFILSKSSMTSEEM